MDAMHALDASAVLAVDLVGRVEPEQWSNPTPCPDWTVRMLVGHLIAGTQGYCELLRGAPPETVRSILERQSEAAGPDPVAALENAVLSIRAAFAEPEALERTVHHRIGDMPGGQLMAFWIGDVVIHSWDLATSIDAEPELDEQLVEFVYGHYAPIAQGGALYTQGWFVAPTRPLPEDATPLERLIQLVGR
jgi:uncharacterized protein (TIGR03086 family)